MKHPEISRLKELLSYDPDTGNLCWRVKRGKCAAGKIITCLNGSGYIVVRVDNVLLRAHRAAWAMTYNEWPEGEIDHINGNPSDNRLENLRIASREENMRNTKKPITNKSGFKGVSWHEVCGCWQAHIRCDSRNYYLGLFDTAESAHEAYKEASTRLHGIFSCHG
jgi:hypothetical protein